MPAYACEEDRQGLGRDVSSPGGTGDAYAINEGVSDLGELGHAVLVRSRSDQRNEAHFVRAAGGNERPRLFGREVNDDEAIAARGRALHRGARFAKGEYRVVVAHEKHRRLEPLGARFADEAEAVVQRDAVGHGDVVGVLDRRAVSQRVGEGHADFDHIRASRFHREEDRYGVRPRGVAAGDVGDEERAAFMFGGLEDFSKTLGHGSRPCCEWRAGLRPTRG